MNAVDGQYNHDGEVGQEQRRVKKVPVVEVLEGLISSLHRLQVVAQAILRCKGEMRTNPQRQPENSGLNQAGGGFQKGFKRGEQGEPPPTG